MVFYSSCVKMYSDYVELLNRHICFHAKIIGRCGLATVILLPFPFMKFHWQGFGLAVINHSIFLTPLRVRTPARFIPSPLLGLVLVKCHNKKLSIPNYGSFLVPWECSSFLLFSFCLLVCLFYFLLLHSSLSFLRITDTR